MQRCRQVKVEVPDAPALLRFNRTPDEGPEWQAYRRHLPVSPRDDGARSSGRFGSIADSLHSTIRCLLCPRTRTFRQMLLITSPSCPCPDLLGSPSSSTLRSAPQQLSWLP